MSAGSMVMLTVCNVYDLLQFRTYTRNTSAVVYLFLGKYGIECHFERTNERTGRTQLGVLYFARSALKLMNTT